MPKNIDVTSDQSQLQYIAAPGNTGLMEHKDVSSLVIGALTNKGFGIQSEEYRISVNKEVVQGVIHLIHPNNDSESSLMFTWINSYDKTTGFRTEMGACANNSFMGPEPEFFIEFESKAFRRNSTDLVNHTKQYVEERIDEGLNNFSKFIAVRDKLKVSAISQEEKERMMGTLFFKDAITSSQLISIKNSFKLPHVGNVWNIWCEITKTFSSCHPKAWFKQQAAISQILMDRYITPGPVVDPAQTDLVSMIPHGSDWDIDKAEEVEFPQQVDFNESEETPPTIEEKAEEPKVLSLTDYDLATKENTVELVEAAEPEEEEVPEPVDEAPIFTLDEYEPSDFPVAPEELPVWVNTNEDESKDEQDSHSESEGASTEDANLDEESSIGVTTPVHEPVLIIEPKEAVEQVSEENTDLVVTPLEEQVAMSEVQPVSEAELEVSKEPVIDEPVIEPVVTVDNNSKEQTLESPNFEF